MDSPLSSFLSSQSDIRDRRERWKEGKVAATSVPKSPLPLKPREGGGEGTRLQIRDIHSPSSSLSFFFGQKRGNFFPSLFSSDCDRDRREEFNLGLAALEGEEMEVDGNRGKRTEQPLGRSNGPRLVRHARKERPLLMPLSGIKRRRRVQ